MNVELSEKEIKDLIELLIEYPEDYEELIIKLNAELPSQEEREESKKYPQHKIFNDRKEEATHIENFLLWAKEKGYTVDRDGEETVLGCLESDKGNRHLTLILEYYKIPVELLLNEAKVLEENKS